MIIHSNCRKGYTITNKFIMTQKKTALITGVTGQDGSYLAEFLLNKNYIVHGIKRRSSIIKTDRIDHLFNDPHHKNVKFFLHYGDMTDSLNLTRIIKEVQPDEIYNLAAMSHVRVSFDTPEYTANADGIGTLRLLEAIRLLGLENKTKIYQASTSELYGLVQEMPQNEKTPFYPRSPYAAAKIYAYWITVNYREAYNIFACNGILFNHESPNRGETFVTRKITMTISKIVYGYESTMFLGNIDAKRDWGHAKDYVKAMWLILQQEKPEDFVVATGKTNTVREFLRIAFKLVGIEIKYLGVGIDEVGVISKINVKKHKVVTGLKTLNIKVGQKVILIDPYYFRPTEVDVLLGDPTKIRLKTGWVPEYNFNTLVEEMMSFDINKMKKRYNNA
jgi:GDPmannose 4,6-dehydratase